MIGSGGDARPANLPVEVDIVGARLDRAADHFKSFGDAWTDHLASRPHRMDFDIDEDGHGRVLFLKLHDPPATLSLILGEFLYELRAALDNALYAVAIIDSGQNPPPKASQLEWPICTTPKSWESHRRRRLSALSEDLVSDLHLIQPFQADYPAWNSLMILHDMARADRHRAVHLVTSFAANGWMRWDKDLVQDLEIRMGPVGDDGILATFTWHGDFDITPDYIDGESEFDVEVAGVELAPGPNSPDPMRPWGNLEKRLRSLHRAVTEYVYGLISHALDLRDQKQPPHVEVVG